MADNESPRNTTTEDGATGTTPNDPAATAGAAEERNQVEEKLAKEQELGYRGYKPDPTPNEHYTLAGVGEGLPTPETVSHPERVRMRAEAEVRLGDAEAEHYAKETPPPKTARKK